MLYNAKYFCIFSDVLRSHVEMKLNTNLKILKRCTSCVLINTRNT